MHLDIYREFQKEGIGFDQEAFDLWREQYNTVRPHESLGMKTPSEIYEKSLRKYKGTPEKLYYTGMQERKVSATLGTIHFEKERYKLTAAIGGWSVGLKVIDESCIEVWFAHQLLGHIDPSSRGFTGLRKEDREAGHSEEKMEP